MSAEPETCKSCVAFHEITGTFGSGLCLGDKAKVITNHRGNEIKRYYFVDPLDRCRSYMPAVVDTTAESCG